MSAIDDVKARIDIVELIGQRVPLKRSGRSFRGSCPFHADRTPSFFVYPDDWSYHCFGCQAHGNGFDNVMATDHLDFRDALKLLADRAGITLEPPAKAAVEDALVQKLRAVNEAAVRFYHHLLLNTPEGQVARDYLGERHVDQSSVEQFQLGYAPDSWDRLIKHLTERGYTPDEISQVGLAIVRESGSGIYDRFRHRLMFPICDRDNHVIGFGGRTLRSGDVPKYLNTPQTPLFDKGATLFAFNRAKQPIRQRDEVVLVEGYLDAVALHQAGFRNVVATMGTALSQRHLSQLHRLARRIVLALDPDTAGDEATLRNVELAGEVMERREIPIPTASGRIRFEQTIDAELRVARLPDGLDPDELVERDPAAWEQLVAEARPVVDFVFDSVLSKLDPSKPEDRDAARQRLLPVVREVSDRVQQAHYLQRLARVIQVDERLLRLELSRRGRSRSEQAGEPETAESAVRLNAVDAYALWLLLSHGQLWSAIDDLDAQWLRDPDARRVFSEFRECGSPQELRDRLIQYGLAETLERILSVSRPPMSAEEVDAVWKEVLAQLRRRYLKERIDALGLFCQEAFAAGDAGRVAALGQEIQQLTGELLEIDRSSRSPRRAVLTQ